MKKWNLVIDVAECENCNNCLLAAKDELVGNTHPGYSSPHPKQGTGVIRIERKTRGVPPIVDAAYLPRMCNHCDEAPCMQADAAKGGRAIRKRDDGIVLFDPEHAKGRKDLVDACPYGAVVWNEEEQLPQTWFFDAHLLDKGWAAPRVVAVCPTGAIQAVKLTDAEMAEQVRSEGLRALSPELGTKPRVHYRNLDRYDRLFIGGALEAFLNGRVDCLEGAAVELWHEQLPIQGVASDAFGEFRFGGLQPHSGEYELRIQASNFPQTVLKVLLKDESVVVTPIRLEEPSKSTLQ